MAINKINSKSIEDLQISAADLASGSISTGKIQDNAITGIKIANSIDVTDVNVSGSLGVGTTDPQDKVHIYKGSSGKVGFANNTALLVEDDSNVAIQLSSPSSTNGQILFGDEGSNASGMIQYEHDNDRLGIFTNVSRRISIDSDGIKFGTDTAAANALDDYEEGTWTPTIGEGTLSGQGGRYVKVGNIVHITGYIFSPTERTLTTEVTVGGLPFSAVLFGGDYYSYDTTVGTCLARRVTFDHYVVAKLKTATELSFVDIDNDGANNFYIRYADFFQGSAFLTFQMTYETT